MKDQSKNITQNAGFSALRGVRVIDFGHTIMGPTCGMVLADLGADVIRVEPINGDKTRRLKSFASGFFGAFNRNKRSLCVDLKSEEGKRTIRELIKTTDVVVENFGPGVMDRLGLGYESLKDINPQLIFNELKGYMPGPYQHLPALDEVVQMQAGLAYMTGPPGRPLRAGASIVDITGGLFGVIGIFAALRQREVTGQGQLIRSTLFESTAFLVAQHIAGAAAARSSDMPPMPARHGGAWCVYDVLQTADTPVFIAITSPDQWTRFIAQFPDFALDGATELDTHEKLVAAREGILSALRDFLAGLTSAEVVARCRAGVVACARISRPDELNDDPQLAVDGGMLETVLAPEISVRLPNLPLEMNGTRAALSLQPPQAGAHSVEILKQAGFGDEDIQMLLRKGVIRDASTTADDLLP